MNAKLKVTSDFRTSYVKTAVEVKQNIMLILKFSGGNDECARCGVEKNTSRVMMNCVVGGDRSNQFQEKMIVAYKGYEHLTKT